LAFKKAESGGLAVLDGLGELAFADELIAARTAHATNLVSFCSAD
jgi:hypothetical protein